MKEWLRWLALSAGLLVVVSVVYYQQLRRTLQQWGGSEAAWETREMFERYAIRDEGHLAQAAAKLNSKATAKSPPTPESSPSVS